MPIIGWIISALGALTAKAFGFFFAFTAYKLARNMAVAVSAIALAGFLTLGMAQAIKALILLARIAMPHGLGMATYFLPSNINQIIALAITIKTSHFIWQWSMKNLARFTMQTY